ncbi:MAG: prepilin-type N-terminal cleavage/methylation domain-containing protein, partial [Gammaproteobacteria bacterium]|nr:prepilin-type N-terminal cleavage/methylation domain-containing protein [Gammaproteobacteria bacterium]
MKTQINKQSGFTLVEIAIVLVIVGLLLGGILKGQELINSARVRNLADTSAGTQAAYYGFIDRYRRVPGDMLQAEADKAIQPTVNAGGDGNGRLDDSNGATEFKEAAALWEHLAKAGFIKGTYDGLNGGSGGAIPADEASYRRAGAPINAFNEFMVLGRTDDYQGTGPAMRLNLVFGRGIPVDIARELDIKVDDGRPQTGVLRLTNKSAAPATFG